FSVITHNVPSVMRVADYIGTLFRSRLVAFGKKDDMRPHNDPIVRQFLSGERNGPLGMDEMADAASAASAGSSEIRGRGQWPINRSACL
ncbi:MAG: hypothetical protein ACYCUF_10635, partial [Acidimicrobiales bacterium]